MGTPLTESRSVWLYDGKGAAVTRRDIVREVPLEVWVDGRLAATIACLGAHTNELAVGFLRAEGWLEDRRDLADLAASPGGDRVDVRLRPSAAPARRAAKRLVATSGACTEALGQPLPMSPPASLAAGCLAPAAIIAGMETFLRACRLHDLTGATHAAALAGKEGLLAVREDIGRHNAIDMLAGYAFLQDVSCRDKAIFRTGRVSAEIVQKIHRLGVPLVASLSVPTALALALAEGAGITLVGAVRGGRLMVYTHPHRVFGTFSERTACPEERTNRP